MIYYHHEKERLSSVFGNAHKVKVPVQLRLRDRSNVTLSPQEVQLLGGIVGNDDKKIKALLSHKNIISATLMAMRENFKQINNNKKSRRSR